MLTVVICTILFLVVDWCSARTATSYQKIGYGACWNAASAFAGGTALLNETDNEPASCFTACVREYGNDCAGFDTRSGCQIYTLDGDAAARAATHKNIGHFSEYSIRWWPRWRSQQILNPSDERSAVHHGRLERRKHELPVREFFLPTKAIAIGTFSHSRSHGQPTTRCGLSHLSRAIDKSIQKL